MFNFIIEVDCSSAHPGSRSQALAFCNLYVVQYLYCLLIINISQSFAPHKRVSLIYPHRTLIT